MVIDSTPGGFPELQTVLANNYIPYVSFDYSIISFVRILQKFLNDKGASDVVLIFQSESDAKMGIWNFLRQSTIRVIILSELSPTSIERLKYLRPTPDFFAIIASTQNMKILFKKVSCAINNFGIVISLTHFKCRPTVRG